MNTHASAFRKAALALTLGLVLPDNTALAGSATWANIPTNLDWNVAGNWVPATVPNGPVDTATIGASFAHSIAVMAPTEVDGIAFTPDATGPYAITTNAGNTLTISGIGITNNSGTTHDFVTSATLAFQGLTRFTNSATAGIMTHFITAGGDTNGGSGGMTQFNDTSTAAFASFLNGGGTVGGALGGMTQFNGMSSASHGIFTNNPGVSHLGEGSSFGGTTEFRDNSTADSASITNMGADTSIGLTTGGETMFWDNSTAAQAFITNRGSAAFNGKFARTWFFGTATAGHANFLNASGLVPDALGGVTVFENSSSAGDATFTSEGEAVSGAYGGQIDFAGNSTSANANITAYGGAVGGTYGGFTYFTNNSNAGSSTIIANGGAVSDAFGGYTEFDSSASAQDSTLIANGGALGGPSGGAVRFRGISSGGTARVEVFGNGTLDIRGHSSPGVTIGSIEGDGTVFLGANTLTVGSNNQSTEFPGAIQNGGGSVNGSLVKIGAGKLTLSGTNVYTGGTTVSGGTLAVNGSILGTVTVDDGATLAGSGTIGGLVTVESGGTLSPGDSPGALSVGALTLESGSLSKFELAGAMPAEYDRVNVLLAASLDGTLHVSLDPKFNPTAGDLFDLLDWGNVTGTFSTIELPALTGGVMWNASQLYTDGILLVTLLGDHNHDGTVDAADYVTWRKTGGSVDDYNTWRAHFGQTFSFTGTGSGASANTTVPEPATMVMMVFATAGWCFRRRQAA